MFVLDFLTNHSLKYLRFHLATNVQKPTKSIFPVSGDGPLGAKSSSVKQEQSDTLRIPSPPFTSLGSIIDRSLSPYSEEDGSEIIGIYSRNPLVKSRGDASKRLHRMSMFSSQIPVTPDDETSPKPSPPSMPPRGHFPRIHKIRQKPTNVNPLLIETLAPLIPVKPPSLPMLGGALQMQEEGVPCSESILNTNGELDDLESITQKAADC